MSMKHTVYLHTGTNLGDRLANLNKANTLIAERVGGIIAQSSWYETAAWGVENQPDFINQVLMVTTTLSAQEVLKKVLEIETEMGRVRKQKWGERLIDIDILFYNDAIINQPDLTIPHPYLQERNFVLAPLQEIAPDLVHPKLKKNITRLYQLSTDTLSTRKYTLGKPTRKPMNGQLSKYNFIAIEGNIGAGKTTLCEMLAKDYNCRLVLEEFTDNPFLPLFYENPERHAFSVELFFMTERHKQLQQNLANRDLFQQTTIADYFFIKTLLFAKQNLKTDEYSLFQRIFNILNATFPKPDILLYLHRPTEVLMKNIRKRGRAFEQEIEPAYLDTIQKAYFDYFRTETEIPVVIVEVGDINFIENENYYQELINLMNDNYKTGMNYIQVQ